MKKWFGIIFAVLCVGMFVVSCSNGTDGMPPNGSGTGNVTGTNNGTSSGTGTGTNSGTGTGTNNGTGNENSEEIDIETYVFDLRNKKNGVSNFASKSVAKFARAVEEDLDSEAEDGESGEIVPSDFEEGNGGSEEITPGGDEEINDESEATGTEGTEEGSESENIETSDDDIEGETEGETEESEVLTAVEFGYELVPDDNGETFKKYYTNDEEFLSNVEILDNPEGGFEFRYTAPPGEHCQQVIIFYIDGNDNWSTHASYGFWWPTDKGNTISAKFPFTTPGKEQLFAVQIYFASASLQRTWKITTKHGLGVADDFPADKGGKLGEFNDGVATVTNVIFPETEVTAEYALWLADAPDNMWGPDSTYVTDVRAKVSVPGGTVTDFSYDFMQNKSLWQDKVNSKEKEYKYCFALINFIYEVPGFDGTFYTLGFDSEIVENTVFKKSE